MTSHGSAIRPLIAHGSHLNLSALSIAAKDFRTASRSPMKDHMFAFASEFRR